MKKKSSGKNKLDLILDLERKQIKGQKRIEELEKKEINRVDKLDSEEHLLSNLEKKQLEEFEDLKNLELKIREKVGVHPLRKVTYKDIGKSMIGAFVGLVSHFAILEGAHFAENITTFRANLFFIISFSVGLIMIYYTGFRKVNDPRLFAILPLRLIIVYTVTIISTLIALFVFGGAHFETEFLYRQVAVLSLPAIIGACAADLIGGE